MANHRLLVVVLVLFLSPAPVLGYFNGQTSVNSFDELGFNYYEKTTDWFDEELPYCENEDEGVVRPFVYPYVDWSGFVWSGDWSKFVVDANTSVTIAVDVPRDAQILRLMSNMTDADVELRVRAYAQPTAEAYDEYLSFPTSHSNPCLNDGWLTEWGSCDCVHNSTHYFSGDLCENSFECGMLCTDSAYLPIGAQANLCMSPNADYPLGYCQCEQVEYYNYDMFNPLTGACDRLGRFEPHCENGQLRFDMEEWKDSGNETLKCACHESPVQHFGGAACNVTTECPDGCLNGGFCGADGTCNCSSVAGAIGALCEVADCPKGCENGGRCVGPDQCDCSTAHYFKVGDDGINSTTTIMAVNYPGPLDSTCGVKFERRCTSGCGGFGICRSPRHLDTQDDEDNCDCVLDSGLDSWFSPDCSYGMYSTGSLYSSANCYNGGKWLTTEECVCPPGFYGPHCEYDELTWMAPRFGTWYFTVSTTSPTPVTLSLSVRLLACSLTSGWIFSSSYTDYRVEDSRRVNPTCGATEWISSSTSMGSAETYFYGKHSISYASDYSFQPVQDVLDEMDSYFTSYIRPYRVSLTNSELGYFQRDMFVASFDVAFNDVLEGGMLRVTVSDFMLDPDSELAEFYAAAMVLTYDRVPFDIERDVVPHNYSETSMNGAQWWAELVGTDAVFEVEAYLFGRYFVGIPDFSPNVINPDLTVTIDMVGCGTGPECDVTDLSIDYDDGYEFDFGDVAVFQFTVGSCNVDSISFTFSDPNAVLHARLQNYPTWDYADTEQSWGGDTLTIWDPRPGAWYLKITSYDYLYDSYSVSGETRQTLSWSVDAVCGSVQSDCFGNGDCTDTDTGCNCNWLYSDELEAVIDYYEGEFCDSLHCSDIETCSECSVQPDCSWCTSSTDPFSGTCVGGSPNSSPGKATTTDFCSSRGVFFGECPGTQQWYQKSLASSGTAPEERMWNSNSVVECGGRMYVYGGQETRNSWSPDVSSEYGDFWAVDLESGGGGNAVWEQLEREPNVTQRSLANVMCFGDSRLVVFGGVSNTVALPDVKANATGAARTDVLSYDIATRTWSVVYPNCHDWFSDVDSAYCPGSAGDCSLAGVYSANDGSCSSVPQPVTMPATAAFEYYPADGYLVTSGTVTDAAGRSGFFLFGGVVEVVPTAVYPEYVWVFLFDVDGNGGEWYRLPDTWLPGRIAHAAAYHAATNRLFVAGGFHCWEENSCTIPDDQVDVLDTVSLTMETSSVSWWKDFESANFFSSIVLVGENLVAWGGVDMVNTGYFSDFTDLMRQGFILNVHSLAARPLPSKGPACVMCAAVAFDNRFGVDGTDGEDTAALFVFGASGIESSSSTSSSSGSGSGSGFGGSFVGLGLEAWVFDVGVNHWAQSPVNTSANSLDGAGPSARAGAAAVVWDDKLYVYGGVTGSDWFEVFVNMGDRELADSEFGRVHVFDLEDRSWSAMDFTSSTLGRPVQLAGSAYGVTDDGVFVMACGTGDTHEPSPLVYAFDIPSSTWLTPVNILDGDGFAVPMTACVGAALGSEFYFLGGLNTTSGEWLTERLYSWSDTLVITELASLPGVTSGTRAGASLVAGRGVLYSFGGVYIGDDSGDYSGIIYEYSVAGNEWTAHTLASVSHLYILSPAVGVGGVPFIFSSTVNGDTVEATLDQITRFSSTAGLTTEPSPRFARGSVRAAHGAQWMSSMAAGDDYIVLFGGMDDEGAESNVVSVFRDGLVLGGLDYTDTYTKGGSLLTVNGGGFQVPPASTAESGASPVCLFEFASASGSSQADESQFACTVPSSPLAGPGSVRFSIALKSKVGGVGYPTTYQVAVAKTAYNYTSCPLGQFASDYRVACDVCAEGSFANTTGSVECFSCPAGQWQNATGSSACRDCPRGSVAETVVECVACSPGSYSSEFNSAEPCSSCGTRQYQPESGATSCLSCPANSTADIGSTQRTDCICDIGYYGKDGETCTECDTKTSRCRRPGMERPQPKPGYWRNSENEMLACVPAEACPGYANNSCAAGYDGDRCSECAAEHYHIGSECEPCPKNGALPMILMGVACLLIVLVLVAMASNIAASGGARGVFGIAVTFIQVTAVFGALQLRWPKQMVWIFRVFSLLNLNMDLASPECAVDVSFGFKWGAMMALPFIFIVLFAVFYVLRCIYSLLCGCLPASVQEWSVDIPGVVQDAQPFKSRTLAELREDGDNFIHAYLMFLALAYVFLTGKSIEIYACFESGGAHFLLTSPSTECYAEEWWQMFPFSLAGMVVYGIGIPAGFSYLLFGRYKQMLANGQGSRFKALFGFLTVRYERKYFWWEMAVMLRKAGIILCTILFNDIVILQGIGALTVMLVAVLGQVFARPFVFVKDDRLEFVTLVTDFLVLFCGILFVSDDLQRDSGTYNFLVYLSVIMMCLSLGGIILYLMVEARMLIVTHRYRKIARDPDVHDILEKAESVLTTTGRYHLLDWLRTASAGDKGRLERILGDIETEIELDFLGREHKKVIREEAVAFVKGMKMAVKASDREFFDSVLRAVGDESEVTLATPSAAYHVSAVGADDGIGKASDWSDESSSATSGSTYTADSSGDRPYKRSGGGGGHGGAVGGEAAGGSSDGGGEAGDLQVNKRLSGGSVGGVGGGGSGGGGRGGGLTQLDVGSPGRELRAPGAIGSPATRGTESPSTGGARTLSSVAVSGVRGASVLVEDSAMELARQWDSLHDAGGPSGSDSDSDSSALSTSSAAAAAATGATTGVAAAGGATSAKPTTGRNRAGTTGTQHSVSLLSSSSSVAGGSGGGGGADGGGGGGGRDRSSSSASLLSSSGRVYDVPGSQRLIRSSERPGADSTGPSRNSTPGSQLSFTGFDEAVDGGFGNGVSGGVSGGASGGGGGGGRGGALRGSGGPRRVMSGGVFDSAASGGRGGGGGGGVSGGVSGGGHSGGGRSVGGGVSGDEAGRSDGRRRRRSIALGSLASSQPDDGGSSDSGSAYRVGARRRRGSETAALATTAPNAALLETIVADVPLSSTTTTATTTTGETEASRRQSIIERRRSIAAARSVAL